MMFQSTHPCGVRLVSLANPCYDYGVSIHAPVWGATQRKTDAPATAGFNPRTRVGCDHWLVFFFRLLQVSIHAPVWGATSQR